MGVNDKGLTLKILDLLQKQDLQTGEKEIAKCLPKRLWAGLSMWVTDSNKVTHTNSNVISNSD